MPEVVDPRRDRAAGTDSGVGAEQAEGGPDALVDDAGAAQRHEHGVGGRVRVELQAAVLVALKRFQRAGVQGHLARLAELRAADDQDRVGGVDVVAMEVEQRLADPQSGGSEQPEQGLVGGGPRGAGGSTARGMHERQLVLVGVDERCWPSARDADQAGWRHLGAGVDPGQIASEPAHRRHPMAGDGAARRPVTVQRPLQRRRDGDVLVAGGVEILDEPRQLASGVVELVPEHPPQPQIVLQLPGEGAHRVAPGHGRATWRSRPRSTLA